MSCNMPFNRDCSNFYMSCAVSLITLIFSSIMLGTQNENHEIYFVLLSSIISIWIPSPQLPKINKSIESPKTSVFNNVENNIV